MVRSLDESFGRIMAHLKQRGIEDRTIVIFASDNGGYNGVYRRQQVTDNAPLRSGKGSLYEGGIRVPLLIHWPGVTAPGVVCREPVVSTDLFHTLLAMTGLAPSKDEGASADGRSLTPLLKDAQAHLGRDALFFHYPHYYSTTSPVSAVRAGDWKLLAYHEDRHLALYNLRDALSEQTTLAQQKADKARELRDRLHAWLSAVGAQMPNANPKARPGR